ncbi:MAG: carboxypeptidase-like regulatory domain-containing protein [Armatimonadota bacterium]
MFRIASVTVLLLVVALCLVASLAQAQPLDEMMIGGWWVPQDRQLDPAVCSEYAQAGFNTLIGEITSTPVDNKKILDNCERYGIKFYLYDSRAWNIQLGDPNFNATLDAVVAEYAGYPALAGYFLKDEPSATDFARLGAINDYLLTKDSSRGAFINLFPNYATPSQLGTSTYAQYLDQFLTTVHPTLMSWDHYSQMTTGNYTGDAYFQNLESVRTRALANNKSFNNIFLLMGHYNFRPPTYGELRWQVFTTLAYGARGYMYFTYWTPLNDPNVTGTGAIDYYGNQTAYYPMIQELNGETKILAPMLVNLESDSVYHTGYVPSGCTALPPGEVITSVTTGGQPASSLLGFFYNSGGTRYVMVVNKDMQYARTLTINFSSIVPLYEVSKTTGEHVRVGRQQSFSLPFDVGEGRLFAIDPSRWEWNVNDEMEQWWIPQGVANLWVGQGALQADVIASDPYLLGPQTPLIDAAQNRYVYLRMATTAGTSAGLLWLTPTEQTYSETRAARFNVIADGQYHEYLLDMAAYPTWTGTVEDLRFEPSKVVTSGHFSIDFIRVAGDVYPATGSVVINSGADYTESALVTFGLSAQDTDTGVWWMRASNDNVNWNPWVQYTTTTSWYIPATEGKHYAYVQFGDGAGSGSKSYYDSIIYDTLAPDGSVTINLGAQYTRIPNVNLTLSATDTGSGVSQMRFSNDNLTWSAWESYATSKPWTLSSGDGLKTVYAQFQDAAGHIATCTDSITLDSTIPLITGTVTSGGLPVEGVTVTYDVQSVLTNASGYYEIPNGPTGQLLAVRASKAGYLPQKRWRTMVPEGNVLDINLPDAGGNLLTNPGFEDGNIPYGTNGWPNGPAGWDVDPVAVNVWNESANISFGGAGTAYYRAGEEAEDIIGWYYTCPPCDGYLSQTISVARSSYYTAKVWLKSIGPNWGVNPAQKGELAVQLIHDDQSVTELTSTLSNFTDWQQQIIDFNTPADVATVKFIVRAHIVDAASPAPYRRLIVDDAELKPLQLWWSDGFESGNFTAGGWTNSGCTIQNTYKYSGTYAAQFNSSDSLTKPYSTSGKTDIKVEYARYTRQCESTDHFISEWSTNGTIWTTLENLTGNSAWTVKLYQLPTEADNQSGFRIRFRTSGNGSTDYAYVDDVKIIGL